MRPLREPDAAGRLGRALKASAVTAGVAVEVADARARPWSSATFTGERVELTLRVAPEAAAWIAGLGEADLPMRGWFVADLVAASLSDDGVAVEALVLRAA